MYVERCAGTKSIARSQAPPSFSSFAVRKSGESLICFNTRALCNRQNEKAKFSILFNQLHVQHLVCVAVAPQ